MIEGLLLFLLILFFFSLAILPIRNLRAIIAVSVLGIFFVIVNYAYLLLLPTKILLLPFLTVEYWGNYKVVSLDWGQLVVLCVVGLVWQSVRNRKVIREKQGTPINQDSRKQDEHESSNLNL